jgi:hypothetical protein
MKHGQHLSAVDFYDNSEVSVISAVQLSQDQRNRSRCRYAELEESARKKLFSFGILHTHFINMSVLTLRRLRASDIAAPSPAHTLA